MAKSVLTIGTFDGVHVGHAAILSAARGLADSLHARVVALVFDPHPTSILRPGKEPARLSTFRQRSRWLRECGADAVQRLEPSRDLLSLGPEDFITLVKDHHSPVGFVEGADFRFGKGRAGDVSTLARLGERLGFQTVILDRIGVDLEDQTIVGASSTIIRELVAAGRVRDAARVLGRPYELVGQVVTGDRRGRTIGYPTANLKSECAPPGDGVYAAWACLPDSTTLPAAVSVGTKPTFGEHARAVEAFIFRPDAALEWSPLPGIPEYGWDLTLRLVGWIRDQVRFGSLPELLDQMARDCQAAKRLLNREPATSRCEPALR